MHALLRFAQMSLQRARWYALAGLLAALAACGGGGETPNFSISGQVTGLIAGGSVSLQNGNEQLTVSNSGTFTFRVAVPLSGSYNVTVLGQSAGQTCSLAGNSGAGAGINSNITSIRITCSVFTYSIGGTASGLQGGTVTLLNNGADALAVSANGTFTFANPVAFGGSYNVTVANQPAGQTCSVSAGTGSGINANVASVALICSTNTFSIGGALTGASNTVTLSLNGGNFLSLGTNGTFTFAPRIAFGGNYNVVVSTNPIGQTCTVSDSAGAGINADVTNISVICATNTFSIGGAVSGASNTVTLSLDGGNFLSLGTNGTFTFAQRIAFAGSYNVAVSTNPVGQTCTVNNGVGRLVTADVTNIDVVCSTNTFTISGNVTGLQGTVTLNLNGGNPLSIGSNGSFTFATPVSFGGNYNVTIATQPIGQSCTVSNGVGRLVSANVQNIAINCVPNTFSIGGSATGLSEVTPITLELTLGGASIPTESIETIGGSFTFAGRFTAGTNYAVSYLSRPDRICSLSNASGTVGAADINNVSLSCVIRTFSVSASVSGLFGGETLTLRLTDNNNVATDVIATSSSANTTAPIPAVVFWSNRVDYGGSFRVTVPNQFLPSGKFCGASTSPLNPSTNVTADVLNVPVVCSFISPG